MAATRDKDFMEGPPNSNLQLLGLGRQRIVHRTCMGFGLSAVGIETSG